MLVLTREINEYDQDGDYFVALFKSKESAKINLKKVVKKECNIMLSDEEVDHIIEIGGRRGYEDVWFNLFEEPVN